jgi:hypothetical protein
MDQHMQQLRDTQQGLVATVELACRRALGHRFGRLMLVGSAALRVETPGSDVDVVCFTRRSGTEAVGLPAHILHQVHWALTELITQYADSGNSFNMELIDDARVPILRVLWGPAGSPVAVDVSVDQSRPVDHVRWFQRVGAAPRPQTPPPAVAPLVTLTLRCAKWWLRQRQIPRTKEGGLPTLAWLLMAVHVCSLPETHEQAIISNQRPMAALLASLTAFFNHYAATSSPGPTDGLDGVLIFAADGSSSEFRQHDQIGRLSPWAELSVLDPTREGAERLNLAPRLFPATQLLLAYELRRASRRLESVPRGGEASTGQSRRLLDEVFESLPEGTNELPSYIGAGGLGALVLSGELSKGVPNIELVIIDEVRPRPGWQAPFLHRSDDRSELSVRLVDVDEQRNRCIPRKKGSPITVAPCHFVCRVGMEKEVGNKNGYTVGAEGLTRFGTMRQYLRELSTNHERMLAETKLAQKVPVPSVTPTKAAAAPAIGTLPSPSRVRSSPDTTTVTCAAAPIKEQQS